MVELQVKWLRKEQGHGLNNMKLYNITYKLRKGTKKHHNYTYNTTAKAAAKHHKRVYGKSHVILKVRLA